MRTLKDLTPEIKAKIPYYIEKYTKGVFNGDRYNSFNLQDAEKLINWNYEKCNYKKPVILIAENPYEAQLFFNWIKANDKVFIQILYTIYCIKNEIELPKELSQLGSQLDSQLYSQLYSQLDSQLYSQLGSQLDSQLYSQLRSQLGSQLSTINESYLFTSNIYSNINLAWYKFIKDEFKIDCEIGIMLDSWNDMYMNSGIYSAIFSELVCVISKYPKKVHRNSDYILNNNISNAVEWGYSSEITKFDCFYINGRNVPNDKFLKAKENNITKEDWINEKNEDIKAAWFEILGAEKVMHILQAKKIDETTIVHKNGEVEELSLYKTDFILEEIGEPLAWIKFICPSTESNYLISTNPVHGKVMDAVIDSCPFFGQEIKNYDDYSFSSRG